MIYHAIAGKFYIGMKENAIFYQRVGFISWPRIPGFLIRENPCNGRQKKYLLKNPGNEKNEVEGRGFFLSFFK